MADQEFEAQARSIFHVHDKDASGTVTVKELTNILLEIKLIDDSMEKKQQRSFTKQLLGHADSDQDGKISFEEFKIFYKGMMQAMEQEVGHDRMMMNIGQFYRDHYERVEEASINDPSDTKLGVDRRSPVMRRPGSQVGKARSMRENNVEVDVRSDQIEAMCRVVFHTHDKDGSGELSLKEMVRVLDELKLYDAHMDRKGQIAFTKQILAKGDKDKDGSVGYNEFELFMKQAIKHLVDLGPEAVERLDRTFNRVYQGAGGNISVLPPKKEKPKKKKPYIDGKDLVADMEEREGWVNMCFDQFDHDKTGTIDMAELEGLAMKLGVLTDQDGKNKQRTLTKLMRKFDSDKNGVICKTELSDMYNTFKRLDQVQEHKRQVQHRPVTPAPPKPNDTRPLTPIEERRTHAEKMFSRFSNWNKKKGFEDVDNSKALTVNQWVFWCEELEEYLNNNGHNVKFPESAMLTIFSDTQGSVGCSSELDSDEFQLAVIQLCEQHIGVPTLDFLDVVDEFARGYTY